MLFEFVVTVMMVLVLLTLLFPLSEVGTAVIIMLVYSGMCFRSHV